MSISMTRKDLTAIARERGVVGYGKMNKADLTKKLGIDLISEPKLTEEQKKERNKEGTRIYYQQNREAINEYRRQYNSEHPEK